MIDTFMVEFEKHLRENMASDPKAYSYGPGDVPAALKRMRLAFLTSSYMMTPNVKATCKDLGIATTHKAIREYVNSDHPQQAQMFCACLPKECKARIVPLVVAERMHERLMQRIGRR